MQSTFDIFKNNYLIIIISILFLAGIIAIGVLIYNKNKANGATLMQQYAGKKFGELCSSNAMCGSNKCVNNVCIM